MNPLLRASVPYLIGGALVVGIVLGVRWYGASQYQAGVNKANADHTLAELTEFKTQTARLAGVSTTLEDALQALRDAEPKTIERYTRVEVQSPLPAGCRLGAERLQHINEAGRLANTARQPGPAVPAGAGGDKR
ncbi:hypothetical protein [Achromobacter mucicolens]|uniref:hypothetical protein n=1 Tax=Achromobacter mucicolens TaxID=1389922 RepID=UPI001CBC9DD0|nr:hypothetical protein [Achromobacter mucicolens]UAN04365.1 hypothetical protein K9D24_09600 [Achromobacter mucicolens]